MSQDQPAQSDLTPTELRDLRYLAGIMIPISEEYAVPGADDEAIFAEIVRSLGRDKSAVKAALAILREIAHGDFSDLNMASAQAAAMSLLARDAAEVVALGRAVLQCYYRDDRVMRSLGVEAIAPFPKGGGLEQGDWSLLVVVRGRPQ